MQDTYTVTDSDFFYWLNNAWYSISIWQNKNDGHLCMVPNWNSTFCGQDFSNQFNQVWKEDWNFVSCYNKNCNQNSWNSQTTKLWFWIK